MSPVDCEHWSDGRIIGGGVCALGKYGGRPSLGTCDLCQGKPVRAPDPELQRLVLVQLNGDKRATEGPRRWAMLHRRALAWDAATGDGAAELKFVRRLGAGMGCACNAGWQKHYAANPLDLSSADAYWQWTWRAHNAVNLRLGKPPLTLEEARAKWSNSPATADSSSPT